MAESSKQVLILSDDKRVATIVEQAVEPDAEITSLVIEPAQDDLPQMQVRDFDLIILALSAFDSEPVVALARTSMTLYVGRVPILIISDRPFTSDVPTQILHMDFPFTIRQLCAQVRAVLQAKPAAWANSTLGTR